MAVEYKTPGGIILPSSYGAKMDRSQPSAVRSLGTNMYDTGRFRQYSEYLQAIRIPWVHRVVLKIAETFATNSWNLKQGDNIIDDAYDPFLQLMARPNPWMTGRAFLEMYAMYIELLGEAFITLEDKDSSGRPNELYLPNPANMIVIPDARTFIRGYAFVSGTGQKIPYDVDEVIHIKMPNPFNPYRGFGAVEASADLLDIVKSIVGFESSYFRSGGRIVGVLETDYEVSDDDFTKLKNDWKEFSQDDKARMKTAILQNGLKYTPVAEGLKNIDVTAINNEKRDSILGNWGVPPTKLGITTGSADQMREGDHVFHAETMDSKFGRWEDDIQPLIDLFNASRRWAFARKNFEDDTTKLTNSQKMAMTYSYSVDDIRVYNDQDPLPNGAGQVIMVPTQIMPMKLSDLGGIADDQADISAMAAEPPPDPPPAVPNLPGGPGQSDGASPGGNPNNGTAPGKTGAGAGVKPGANEVTKPPGKKEFDDLVALAGTKGLDLEDRAKLIDQIARKDIMAQRVTNRMFRQPRTFRAPGLGDAKAIRQVSADIAATGIYIRNKLKTFMEDSATHHTALKKAFRIQRREVLKALPEILKEAAKATGAERTSIIREGLAAVLEPRIDDLKRAVAPIHVAGLVTGFATGVHVLPPAQAALVRRRMGNRGGKEITAEGKAAEWRKYVDDWRHDDVKLAAEFDGLAAKAVTNLSTMAISELSAMLEEGTRRSYSALQVMEGNPDEDFSGVAGTLDALEARSAAVVRVEAREAFQIGVAEALGMELKGVAVFHGNQYVAGQGEATVPGAIFHPVMGRSTGSVTTMGGPLPPVGDTSQHGIELHTEAHEHLANSRGKANYAASVRRHVLQAHKVDPGWGARHLAEWEKLHGILHHSIIDASDSGVDPNPNADG